MAGILQTGETEEDRLQPSPMTSIFPVASSC